MDEGLLRLTSRDLEKSSGEGSEKQKEKGSSLDLSLATLHQAENKVQTKFIFIFFKLKNLNYPQTA